MTAPVITAEYIPTLGLPAICIDNHTHTLDVEAADKFIADFTFAVLRARVDAKKLSTTRRLVTPENEVEQLLQMVDLRLAAPDTLPLSPASEVTP